jgi:hypothetical protein
LGVGTEGRPDTAPTSAVDYEQLIGRIRDRVEQLIPAHATVAVVSRGDEVLLQLGRRQTLHFPRDDEGRWAGYHPADSDDAVRLLEEVRESGAAYFVLPSTGFWWLEYYQGFRTHLETRYRVLEAGADCWIVSLLESPSPDAHSVEAPAADTDLMAGEVQLDGDLEALREVVRGLLPDGSKVVFLAVTAAELSGQARNGTPAGLQRADFADPEAAIDHLARLERGGGQFVVVREPLFDWLDDNPDVRARLQRHRFVTRQEHLCEIYEIEPSGTPVSTPTPTPSSKEVAYERPSPARERPSLGARLRRIFFPSGRNAGRP